MIKNALYSCIETNCSSLSGAKGGSNIMLSTERSLQHELEQVYESFLTCFALNGANLLELCQLQML